MLRLFTVENGRIIPTEDTLITYPFSLIWQRDETSHHDRALMDYRYIHQMTYPNKDENPYFGYDETIRGEKIIENIRKTEPNYVIDDLVIEGINQRHAFFNEASPSLALYEGTCVQAKKLGRWLKEFDVSDPISNTLKLKPKDVTNAMKDVDEIATRMDALGKKIQEDLFVVSKTKANRKINPLER